MSSRPRPRSWPKFVHVAFDYTFTDREANTSALVLAPMQALEGCKDSVRIRLRETEAVIGDRKIPIPLVPCSAET